MSLCRPYTVNRSHELWIFTSVIVELERLPSIDRVEEANFHRCMVEIALRMKGDFNIREGFLPLEIT